MTGTGGGSPPLFTFIPSAPLLVAILWLYAKTGSFDFVTLQILIAHGNFPAGAIYWASLAFLMAFAVKVPVFPLHGWLADTFSEAPVALAMVVAGKLGLYSMLRFHIGLFPVQARTAAPWLIALAVIGVLASLFFFPTLPFVLVVTVVPLSPSLPCPLVPDLQGRNRKYSSRNERASGAATSPPWPPSSISIATQTRYATPSAR